VKSPRERTERKEIPFSEIPQRAERTWNYFNNEIV
jgi:hypothetical protein